MQNMTDITIILDRSSSMAICKSATIAGFNVFLDKQKEDPSPAKISLVQFAGPIERITSYSGVNLEHAEALTEATYQPTGNSTALNDAIGLTVDDIGRRLAAMAEDVRPSKVLVVIMTDGGENDSHVYRKYEPVRAKIGHQQTRYNWEFAFIGANQDSFNTAKQYSIPISNTMNYLQNDSSVMKAFSDISYGTSNVRRGLAYASR